MICSFVLVIFGFLRSMNLPKPLEQSQLLVEILASQKLTLEQRHQEHHQQAAGQPTRELSCQQQF